MSEETNNDLAGAISRILESAPQASKSTLKAKAKLQEKQQDNVSDSELDAGKAVLLGQAEDTPKKLTDEDKVKGILFGGEELVPDAPKKPVPLADKHKPLNTSQAFDPDVDVFIQDVRHKIEAQVQDVGAYFKSPTFMRLSQENPLAAQARNNYIRSEGLPHTLSII